MDPRISSLIDSLPTLTKDDVDIHDYCPICFEDFKTILDDDGSESEPAGITKLEGCSHVFCRKDLIQWIRSWHGSCPTCRNIFLSNVYPDSESDDESDDEEYVPNEHDDSDDEEYPNEHDEFEDGEEEEDEDEEEDEEEESFPFESETGDVEDLNAFEEEDNHAIGSGIMDAVFEDFINEELLMEAAASREADAVELAQVAEEVAARMEAELEEVAEPFSFGDLAEEEEEEHRRLEADFFLEAETEECTDLSDWDDSEDLRFSVADSFQPENEGKYLKS